MASQVFLTGASGFVGAHLLRALQGRPDVERIHCLARRPLELADRNKVVELRGALCDLPAHREELRACDHVFHLAANATFGEGASYAADNLEPTRQLAGLLQGSPRLRCLVFTSTIGAVDREPGDPVRQPLTPASRPHPTSDYGRSKLAAEQVLRESGLPCTILRLTWVYGAGMRRNSHVSVFADMARRKSPVLRLGFPGRVSLIHVDDLVRALLACLDNDRARGRTYFAVAESLPLGEVMARTWEACHGRRPAQLPVPALRPLLARLHPRLPLTVNNLLLPYLTAADPDFAADLGLGAFVPFARGVRDVVASRAGDGDLWAITGAGSGIGLALARLLAAEGRRLVLLDRDVAPLAGLAAAGHRVVEADLATAEGLGLAAAALREGRLRCLVNNAGVGFRGSVATLDEARLRLMLEVNCWAPLLLVKQTLGRLVQDGTTIVNVCSSVAYNPLPMMSVYAASKAFLASWSEALGYELRQTNRVITFSPSGTRTGFQRAAGVKDDGGKGLLAPEAVAAEIRRRIQGSGDIVVMGLRSQVLLLASRLLPRALAVRMWGFLFARAR